jgi:hypothetical protein
MEAFVAFGALLLLLPLLYLAALSAQHLAERRLTRKKLRGAAGQPPRTFRQRFRRAHG